MSFFKKTVRISNEIFCFGHQPVQRYSVSRTFHALLVLANHWVSAGIPFVLRHRFDTQQVIYHLLVCCKRPQTHEYIYLPNAVVSRDRGFCLLKELGEIELNLLRMFNNSSIVGKCAFFQIKVIAVIAEESYEVFPSGQT